MSRRLIVILTHEMKQMVIGIIISAELVNQSIFPCLNSTYQTTIKHFVLIFNVRAVGKYEISENVVCFSGKPVEVFFSSSVISRDGFPISFIFPALMVT